MEELARDGHFIPDLEAIPELYEDLYPVWEAFNILSASRDTGFGISCIKFSEIKAYMDEFEPSDRKEFVTYIMALDEEFVKHHSEQSSKKAKKDSSHGTSKRRH